jgi:hypothetical protein
MGLDRERARRGLDEPAPGDAPELRGERGAAVGWDVLDDAGGVGEVERVVVEREAVRGIGLYERPGVLGAGGEIDARDVEVRLHRAQAERAAADVDDRHPGRTPVRAKNCSWRRRRAFAASGPRTRARIRPRAVA